MAILNSILDNDLYKFTMQAAVLHYQRKPIPVAYKFYNRRPEGKFTEVFLRYLREQIGFMASLKLTENEITFLRERCPYLSESYIAYLAKYQYQPDQVKVKLVDGELDLRIEGNWAETILWEVPLMALISELYFITIDTGWEDGQLAQQQLISKKSAILQDVKFSDFGTRRRRNFRTQDLVVNQCKFHNNFLGTSNVHIAHKYGVKPVGTMAHEWIMGMSVLEGLAHANRHALRIWHDCFQGQLGVALTDTYGTEAFWADFDTDLARAYDCIRHDSGDPFEFGENAIKKYRDLGIDPTTKTIVFSDGLTAEKAAALGDRFDRRIRTVFGIGTHLTNDYGDSKPLNMVIKLDRCNGVPVVKLSDVPTKATGDKDAVRIAKWTFFQQPLDADTSR